MLRRLNELNQLAPIANTTLTLSLAILFCLMLAKPTVAQDDILGDIKADSGQQNTASDSNTEQSVADTATTVVDDGVTESSTGNDGGQTKHTMKIWNESDCHREVANCGTGRNDSLHHQQNGVGQ